MSERQDSDGVRRLQIRDVVREPGDRRFPGGYVGGDTRNARSRAWPSANALERAVNGFEKLAAQSDSLPVVPNGRLFKLRGRFGFDSEGAVHWSANRWAMRRRTSSHGSPSDSPANTRLARRSISRAHAASTAAASLVGGWSRLARSSAATSARSSTGRARASRSSSCARLVMESFYTRPPQPRQRAGTDDRRAALFRNALRRTGRGSARLRETAESALEDDSDGTRIRDWRVVQFTGRTRDERRSA